MTAKLGRPARQCLEDRRSAPCNSLVFFVLDLSLVLSQLFFCVCHFKWPMPIPHNYYIYSSYFDTLGCRGISLWSVSKEWSKKGAVEGGAKIKALSAALSSRVTQPSQCSNPDFLSYELSTWSGYTAMKNDQSHELLWTQDSFMTLVFHLHRLNGTRSIWSDLLWSCWRSGAIKKPWPPADQVGSAQWVSNEQWSSGKISFWCNNNL